jgi:hypothetical protein
MSMTQLHLDVSLTPRGSISGRALVVLVVRSRVSGFGLHYILMARLLRGRSWEHGTVKVTNRRQYCRYFSALLYNVVSIESVELKVELFRNGASEW